jgi:hypothetical protein
LDRLGHDVLRHWKLLCIRLIDAGLGRQSTPDTDGMDMQDRNAAPINPLPPIVWILALPIIAMARMAWAGGCRRWSGSCSRPI